MAFKPTSNRVLIRQSDPETTTGSGFIIPQASQAKMNEGTVISTGPGYVTERGIPIPMTVVSGDKITYEPGAAIPIRVDGEDLLVLREDSIIAVVTDE